jgi:osmotically-inducible protein OsmY
MGKDPAKGMSRPGEIEADRCQPWRRDATPGRAAIVAALLLAFPLLCTGCTRVGIATTAVATVGTAATSERGLGTTINDDRIWLEINQAWLAQDSGMFEAVSLQVHEGRVLLSGRVERPDVRVDAVRIAWEVEGVREVINEIEVARATDFGDFLQDNWIISELRNKILFDKQVRSINYSIDSVAGTIYLMGIGQSAAEVQRVIDHARDIPYVRRVVSYVQLKSDPARQAAAGSPS